MRKLLYILYQPYKWLFLLPFTGVYTILCGIIAILVSLIINDRVGSKIIGVGWARLLGRLTPAFIKVSGREHVKKGQSYVIVANHISAYDIIALYGWLGIEFKWVMKKELRKVPGIGFGSAAIGHIFIDRSNTQEALKSMEEAKKKVQNGVSVLFFPEGTRTNKEPMKPFKKGAFRLALDLNLPILPVTIIGTDNVMPNKTVDIFPGKIKLIIHPPIATENYELSTISELMEESRKAISEVLEN